MKPKDIDIVQWSELWKEFCAFDKVVNEMCPPAMRCENSQLTTGWRFGGFTMNGYRYTSFCPRAVHGPCAMLAVREDFLRWVEKKLKKQQNENACKERNICEQTSFSF